MTDSTNFPDIPDLPGIPDIKAIKPDVFPDFTPHIDDLDIDPADDFPVREDSFIPDFFKARVAHCEDILDESN